MLELTDGKPHETYQSLPKLFIFSLTICLGWVNYGIVVVTFNGTSEQVAYSLGWPQDQIPNISQLASSLIFLGLFMACLITTIFCARLSRKNQLIFADILTIIGTILIVSKDVGTYLTGRFILGFAMGINSFVIPIHLREMSPPEVSGRLCSMNKIGGCIGLIISFSMVFGLPYFAEDNDYWISIYIVPAGIALFRSLMILIFYRYDTPKFYILEGQGEKALEVIERIYKPEFKDKIMKNLLSEKKHEKNFSIRNLFSENLRAFLVCEMLSFLCQMEGISVINFYSTKLILGTSSTKTEADVLDARIVNLCIGILRAVCAISSIFFLDKIGRRKMYIAGNAIITLSLVAMVTSMYTEEAFITKITVLTFTLGMAISFTLVNPIYIPECIPFRLVGVVFCLENAIGFLIVQYFPDLVDHTPLRMAGSMSIFLFMAFIGNGMIYRFVKETKGMQMNEIGDMYRGQRTNSLFNS